MEDVGIFYTHLVHFTVFWYILWTFGIFVVIWYIFPVLVFCIKKNLAPLGPDDCVKTAQNVAQRVFLSKLINNFYIGEKKPKNAGSLCM
jgi:hypothetical protein